MNAIVAQAKGLHVLDRKVFATGETIFREGDSGSRAYIVQRGRVDIVKDVDGEKFVVGNIGPGGIFGEMALIDNKPRMASAIVAEFCVCIIVNSAMFQKKLRRLDPFLAGVLRVLVENIRSIQYGKQTPPAVEAMLAAAVEASQNEPATADDGRNLRAPAGPADGPTFEIA